MLARKYQVAICRDPSVPDAIFTATQQYEETGISYLSKKVTAGGKKTLGSWKSNVVSQVNMRHILRLQFNTAVNIISNSSTGRNRHLSVPHTDGLRGQ